MQNFGYLVRRFFSFITDWYLSSIMINLLANGISKLIPLENSIYYALILSSLIVSYFYFVYLPYRFFNGSTFIMRFMVLKVVDENEQLPTQQQLFLRYFIGCLVIEGAFYIASVDIRSALFLTVLKDVSFIAKYIDWCLIGLAILSVIIGLFDFKSGEFKMIHDRISHTKVVTSIKIPNSKEKNSKKLTK